MKAHDLLTDLVHTVTTIAQIVNDKFLHLPEEMLNAKNDGAWSILECIEHLNRYNTFYLQRISLAIRNGGTQNGEVLNTTWIGQKSLAMMRPSNTRKQRTFRKMDPANSRLDHAVLDRFLKDQKALTGLLNKSMSVDVNAKKVPVEFFRLLKMTVAEALEFVVVHEQRHINQALALLNQQVVNKPAGLII